MSKWGKTYVKHFFMFSSNQETKWMMMYKGYIIIILKKLHLEINCKCHSLFHLLTILPRIIINKIVLKNDYNSYKIL